MTTPAEKLAESLAALKAVQDGGAVAIRSDDLSRTHRERLLANGLLQKVMKGWYIPARPDEAVGDSTPWYASFWDFCTAYLSSRFGSDWWLCPEQSISLHAGNFTVPRQLIVRSSRGGNKPTPLLYDTSIFDMRLPPPAKEDIEEKDGVRVLSLAAALVSAAPGLFTRKATDMRAALAMVRDASELLPRLLDGEHTVVAGRLVGAFRNLRRDRIADDILESMRSAGYDVREADPFDAPAPTLLKSRERSPWVNRLRLMWHEMRGSVIERFPATPGLPNRVETYLERVEDAYATDAYHSLSIEGYRVSPELIARVRIGDWNPDSNAADRERRDALAARGYWLAFQQVRRSVERVLKGSNPGTVADEDHAGWYRQMFAPSVSAGLLRTRDLAGYRNGPVHIRRSQHVPPRREAVRDMMPALFELLATESEPSVRVVLGHFMFVYIHPYLDGNGRMGRFVMNVMLAAGGYPWSVIPVERRDEYMIALEQASVHSRIVPFAELLARIVVDRTIEP